MINLGYFELQFAVNIKQESLVQELFEKPKEVDYPIYREGLSIIPFDHGVFEITHFRDNFPIFSHLTTPHSDFKTLARLKVAFWPENEHRSKIIAIGEFTKIAKIYLIIGIIGIFGINGIGMFDFLNKEVELSFYYWICGIMVTWGVLNILFMYSSRNSLMRKFDALVKHKLENKLIEKNN